MPNCFLQSSTVTNLSQFTDQWFAGSQYTHPLCVGIVSFVWNVFLRPRNLVLGFSRFLVLLSTGFISFQVLRAFINRGKSQFCQSSCPLTKSAFILFRLLSTLLVFPDMSVNLPSVSRDWTLYTSFL